MDAKEEIKEETSKKKKVSLKIHKKKKEDKPKKEKISKEEKAEKKKKVKAEKVEKKKKAKEEKALEKEKLSKMSKEEKKTYLKEKKKEKKKNKGRIRFSIFTIFVLLMDIGCAAGLYVINIPAFKTFWVTSAMTTMTHQYLAHMLYDDETINKIMSENYIEQNMEEINLDDIVINETDLFTKRYTNKYEKELFTKMEGNDVFKLIRINESMFKGWLTVIYDPSDVELAVSSKLGRAGQNVSTLTRENDGIVGINGGGFEDLDGWGNGSIPYGAIIKNGELIWDHEGGSGGLIGFTKEHKMYLTWKSPQEAIEDGMMDAVDFGPFLIVNGSVSKIHGDGGWGIAPRSIIAQRKDGVVLFLIIDGRMPGYSIGASMNDVIEILLRYKAYNAANLDGGASTTMSVNGSLWNNPYVGGEYGGRTVSNAWIVTNRQGKPMTIPNKSDF